MASAFSGQPGQSRMNAVSYKISLQERFTRLRSDVSRMGCRSQTSSWTSTCPPLLAIIACRYEWGSAAPSFCSAATMKRSSSVKGMPHSLRDFRVAVSPAFHFHSSSDRLEVPCSFPACAACSFRLRPPSAHPLAPKTCQRENGVHRACRRATARRVEGNASRGEWPADAPRRRQSAGQSRPHLHLLRRQRGRLQQRDRGVRQGNCEALQWAASAAVDRRPSYHRAYQRVCAGELTTDR